MPESIQGKKIETESDFQLTGTIEGALQPFHEKWFQSKTSLSLIILRLHLNKI